MQPIQQSKDCVNATKSAQTVSSIFERIGPHLILASAIGNSAAAQVIVSDQQGIKVKAEVLLDLRHGRWHVEQGMTPAQARMLALKLMAGAERADVLNQTAPGKVAA